METRQFVLTSRPFGLPTSDNFRIETRAVDKLSDNEVLLKSWFISVDPYMRGRMSSAKSYTASYEFGVKIIWIILDNTLSAEQAMVCSGMY